MNCDPSASPDLLFHDGLNFGKVLRAFPELKTVLSRRITPINCLISHVGVNIFDDIVGERLGKDTGCSFDDMVLHYDHLVEILPKFVLHFAEFLTLFKGGRFTYKSLKKDPGEDHLGYFSKDMRSMRAQPIAAYTCMFRGAPEECDHFSFVQDVDDLCPHEALFKRILTDVLSLEATTKINYVGESIAIYSQTVVDIPTTFTGIISREKLDDVIQRFLSKKPTAACSGLFGG